MKKFLNVGCGNRFHPDWVNVDLSPLDNSVITHDLSQGIPFSDGSFEVVYHSHVLEHIPRNQAKTFIQECYRVLKPKGILRVVVPDLESITRTYLRALEKASSGSVEWKANYEWILLEMYDQTVRNHTGGEMAEYLSREEIPNEDFILERMGIEAKYLMESARENRQKTHGKNKQTKQIEHLIQRAYKALSQPQKIGNTILRILSPEGSALQVGKFRNSGEVHSWMYDRYSLACLLEDCGFESTTQCSAQESSIPDWYSYHLDGKTDGSVYYPASLFMEAFKPDKV